MIDLQRELKKAGKDYRAFEVLNLGKYERQHYIGMNPNLRDEEKEKQLAQKEKDFPKSPYILDPDIRWFPADEALREQG